MYFKFAKTLRSFVIKESYDRKMNETLIELFDYATYQMSTKKLSWNDVLRIAHVLRGINPELKQVYTSYSQCSRDEQCGEAGICFTRGGRSECKCITNYTGTLCNWKLENLYKEKKLVDILMEFLNTTLLYPVSKKDTYEVTDINIIDQLANVLIGMLKNPEIVERKHLNMTVELGWYMTRIEGQTGGRMEDYERKNVLLALECGFFHISVNVSLNVRKSQTKSW